VVWTTPLVATLGLSLTIPLAMVADMLVHGRDYSLIYVLGAAGVSGGCGDGGGKGESRGAGGIPRGVFSADSQSEALNVQLRLRKGLIRLP